MSEVELKLVRALKVIAMDQKIRAFLQREDPMALRQAEAAITDAEDSEAWLERYLERMAERFDLDTHERDNEVVR